MIGKLKYIVLLLGVSFIVIGITIGQYHTVMQKAVRICLQCIGIG